MRTIADIIDTLPSEIAAPDLKAELKHRLNGEALYVWKALCSLLRNEQPDMGHDETPRPAIGAGREAIVRAIAVVLLDEDSLSWGKRVEWCQTPDDFRDFFTSLGVKEEQWRMHTWLANEASKPVEEGGIGRSLSMVLQALKKRFGSHSQFIAWMDGKEKPEASLRERVQVCTTREDYLALFKDLGIPGEEWKNSRWLERTSALPSEEGGIGLKLAHLVHYIREKEEFGSFPQFVAWMEGKEKPDDYLTVRIGACKELPDFFALLRELGVPGNEWENTKWLSEVARLSLLLYDLPIGDSWKIERGDVSQVHPQHQFGAIPNIIVGNPLFKETSSEGAKIQKAAQVLERYLDWLAPGGLLGVVLPRTFLHNTSANKTRKRLLETCDILEIWHLPEGMIPSSSVATAVILARKLPQVRPKTVGLLTRVEEVDRGDRQRF